jgi:hypothetical protein
MQAASVRRVPPRYHERVQPQSMAQEASTAAAEPEEQTSRHKDRPMTRCVITATMRNIPSHSAFGSGVTEAVVRCETHNMPMDSDRVTSSDLCPIGKIEEATEIALDKIAHALHIARME